MMLKGHRHQRRFVSPTLIPYNTIPLSIRIVNPHTGLIQLHTLYCRDAPRGPKSDNGTSSPLLHFRHWGRSTPTASSQMYSASRPAQYARQHSKLKGNSRILSTQRERHRDRLRLAGWAEKRTPSALRVAANGCATDSTRLSLTIVYLKTLLKFTAFPFSITIVRDRTATMTNGFS